MSSTSVPPSCDPELSGTMRVPVSRYVHEIVSYFGFLTLCFVHKWWPVEDSGS